MEVHPCWVLAHAGIKGNEGADKIATATRMRDVIDIPLGKGEAKGILEKNNEEVAGQMGQG